MASSPAPHPNIFVRGIPPSWGEAEIAVVFQQYGALSSIRLVRHSVTKQSLGYGFVRFQNFEDARSAIADLDGASVHGQALQVKFADADAGPPASSTLSGLTPSESVYIKHLPANCAPADVMALFDSHVPPPAVVSGAGVPASHVVDVKVFPCLDALRGGSALVRMTSQEAAERAIAALNNVTLPGAAHSLVVRYAESAVEKAARLTRRSAAVAARGAAGGNPGAAAAAAAAAAAMAGMTIVPPGLGILGGGTAAAAAAPGGLAQHHLSLQAALSALTGSGAGIAHAAGVAHGTGAPPPGAVLPTHLATGYRLGGPNDLLRGPLGDGALSPVAAAAAAMAAASGAPGLPTASAEELGAPGLAAAATADDLTAARLSGANHPGPPHDGEIGATAALGFAAAAAALPQHQPSHIVLAGVTSSPPTTALINNARGPAVLSLVGLPADSDRLWLYEQFAPFGAVLHVARDTDPGGAVASITFASTDAAERAMQAVRAGQLGEGGLSASLGLPPLGTQARTPQHLPDQRAWQGALPEWR